MNKKIKNFIFLLIIITLFLIINLGFIGKKKILFWVMPNAPFHQHVPWLKQKAEEFKAKTGVEVQFEEVGWTDAWTRISSALLTGEGADVFQVGTTWQAQFAATDGLAELDIDYFGGKIFFLKANLDSCIYKNKYYGAPWFAETRCLFYNKDIFNEIELEPPKTTEELIEVGKKIIEKKGKGSAISIAGTTAWDLLHNWSIILWSNGGDLLNKDNSEALFNSQEGIKAMQWYVDLVRDGLASDSCAEYNQTQADAAFINANVAMCYMGPWNIARILIDNPSLNYGVVEPPKGPKKKASFSGGSNLSVLEHSNKKKQAFAWIKFLIEEENLIDYTKNLSKMLPAKYKAFDDPYYQSGDFKVFKDTLSYAKAYPTLGVWVSIETIIVEEFKNILADYVNDDYNENTIQKYLDNAVKKVNNVLKEEN